MRILFLHRNFPAQYRHVAAALAADPAHQVAFGTEQRDGALPGVRRWIYRPARAARPDTHPYLQGAEMAVLRGQAVFRLCERLKADGFVPDVICSHAGFGPGLYAKDAFPTAVQLGYFEWFYRARGSDADFLAQAPLSADEACRIRTRNAIILTELTTCDAAICPTEFQRAQFPAPLDRRLSVLHDGIDTDYFTPASEPAAAEFAGAEAVVTYATRGMEPYRGFPTFMRAAARVLRERPRVHVAIAGADRVAYGAPRTDGKGFKQAMLAELPGLDLARVHFLGVLPYARYRALLRLSAAHVYLTVPFVLSWSLLEAMACACPLVGSDTAPVREVLRDGDNALLADFFSADEVAARILWLLDHRERARELGARARRDALARFALRDLLPRHLDLIRSLAR